MGEHGVLMVEHIVTREVYNYKGSILLQGVSKYYETLYKYYL